MSYNKRMAKKTEWADMTGQKVHKGLSFEARYEKLESSHSERARDLLQQLLLFVCNKQLESNSLTITR